MICDKKKKKSLTLCNVTEKYVIIIKEIFIEPLKNPISRPVTALDTRLYNLCVVSRELADISCYFTQCECGCGRAGVCSLEAGYNFPQLRVNGGLLTKSFKLRSFDHKYVTSEMERNIVVVIIFIIIDIISSSSSFILIVVIIVNRQQCNSDSRVLRT